MNYRVILRSIVILWIGMFFLACSLSRSHKGETKHIYIDQKITEEIVYELGILKMEDQKELKLELKNLLQEPVVINDIRGFCGCTVPKFQKEPIIPGKSSVVSILFLAQQTGTFNKELKMYLSSQEEPVSIIFNGEIEKR